MAYVEVCSADEVKPFEGKASNVSGQDIAIFNLNSQFFAVQNACPHRGGPLAEGSLDEEGVVICPWHGYSFDVRTGKPFGFPYPIKTFPLKIENGKIFVDVD